MKILKKPSFYWILCIALVTAFQTGCLPLYQQPTKEQLEMQRAILARLAGKNQPEAVNNKPKEPTITEEELLKKINELPNISKPISYVSKKDGFDINGIRYLDAEGQIVNYSGDALTGDVTYMLMAAPDSYVIKYLKAGTNTEPVKIAYAQRKDDNWYVETVTGKTLNGEALSLLSRGFAVSRGAGIFIYTPGNNIKTMSAPDGFHVATFQNGEVWQTKYILIERDVTPEDTRSVIGSIKSLGATLGINKKEDYALFNIENGHILPLNIDVSGKEVAVHENCVQKNKFINKCASVKFFESLYEKNGLPNSSHYYWRLAWFNTDIGPLVVVREGSKVYIKNLKENKMVVAFERTLGVNWVSAYRNGEGKIEAVAQLGFSKETINDIETFYKEHEAVAIQ